MPEVIAPRNLTESILRSAAAVAYPDVDFSGANKQQLLNVIGSELPTAETSLEAYSEGLLTELGENHSGVNIDACRAAEAYTNPEGYLGGGEGPIRHRLVQNSMLGLSKTLALSTDNKVREQIDVPGRLDSAAVAALPSLIAEISHVDTRQTALKRVLEGTDTETPGDISLLALELATRQEYFPDGVTVESLQENMSKLTDLKASLATAQKVEEKQGVIAEIYLRSTALSTALGFSSTEAIREKDIRNMIKYHPQIIAVLGEAELIRQKGEDYGLPEVQGRVEVGDTLHEELQPAWLKAWKGAKQVWNILNEKSYWQARGVWGDDPLYREIMAGRFTEQDMSSLITHLQEAGKMVMTQKHEEVKLGEHGDMFSANETMVAALMSIPASTIEHARSKRGSTVKDFSDKHGQWLDENLCFLERNGRSVQMAQSADFMETLLGYEITELKQQMNSLLQMASSESLPGDTSNFDVLLGNVLFEISDIYNFTRSYMWYSCGDRGEKLIENIRGLLGSNRGFVAQAA